jgi:hypothetical protein
MQRGIGDAVLVLRCVLQFRAFLAVWPPRNRASSDDTSDGSGGGRRVGWRSLPPAAPYGGLAREGKGGGLATVILAESGRRPSSPLRSKAMKVEKTASAFFNKAIRFLFGFLSPA